MSRWTAITEDHLRTAGHGAILAKARTFAAASTLDPVSEAIADATSDVRSAVGQHNALDREEAKVPNSLKSLTIRLALRPLMTLIGLTQTQDEQRQGEQDDRRLRALENNTDKRRIEAPDAPEETAAIQATGRTVEASNVPPRLTGRERTNGL